MVRESSHSASGSGGADVAAAVAAMQQQLDAQLALSRMLTESLTGMLDQAGTLRSMLESALGKTTRNSGDDSGPTQLTSSSAVCKGSNGTAELHKRHHSNGDNIPAQQLGLGDASIEAAKRRRIGQDDTAAGPQANTGAAVLLLTPGHSRGAEPANTAFKRPAAPHQPRSQPLTRHQPCALPHQLPQSRSAPLPLMPLPSTAAAVAAPPQPPPEQQPPPVFNSESSGSGDVAAGPSGWRPATTCPSALAAGCEGSYNLKLLASVTAGLTLRSGLMSPGALRGGGSADVNGNSTQGSNQTGSSADANGTTDGSGTHGCRAAAAALLAPGVPGGVAEAQPGVTAVAPSGPPRAAADVNAWGLQAGRLQANRLPPPQPAPLQCQQQHHHHHQALPPLPPPQQQQQQQQPIEILTRAHPLLMDPQTQQQQQQQQPQRNPIQQQQQHQPGGRRIAEASFALANPTAMPGGPSLPNPSSMALPGMAPAGLATSPQPRRLPPQAVPPRSFSGNLVLTPEELDPDWVQPPPADGCVWPGQHASRAMQDSLPQHRQPDESERAQGQGSQQGQPQDVAQQQQQWLRLQAREELLQRELLQCKLEQQQWQQQEIIREQHLQQQQIRELQHQHQQQQQQQQLLLQQQSNQSQQQQQQQLLLQRRRGPNDPVVGRSRSWLMQGEGARGLQGYDDLTQTQTAGPSCDPSAAAVAAMAAEAGTVATSLASIGGIPMGCSDSALPEALLKHLRQHQHHR